MSLLDQAVKYERRERPIRQITDEHVELAFAWIRGEIKDVSIRAVLAGGQSYPTIARALKLAYQQGKLVIK